MIAPLPAQVNPTIITIKARDIAAFIQAGTSGAKPASYVSEQPESVCTTAQTTDSASQIALYFFIADAQDNVCGSEITYNVTVDLLAGGVAGTPTAQAGDGLIFVNIPSTTDPDVKYWNVYTDPPPNNAPAAAVEAGVISYPICDASATATVDATVPDATTTDADAATDDGGVVTQPTTDIDSAQSPASPSRTSTAAAPPALGADSAGTYACGSSAVFVSGGGTVTSSGEGGTETVTGGVQRLIPAQYLGKQVGSTTTQAQVSGLTNDVTYNVRAVAAVDAVGNVGPLSVITNCGPNTTPNPVGDFWYGYTKDGGQAGGGSARSTRSGLRPARRRSRS